MSTELADGIKRSKVFKITSLADFCYFRKNMLIMVTGIDHPEDAICVEDWYSSGEFLVIVDSRGDEYAAYPGDISVVEIADGEK